MLMRRVPDETEDFEGTFKMMSLAFWGELKASIAGDWKLKVRRISFYDNKGGANSFHARVAYDWGRNKTRKLSPLP